MQLYLLVSSLCFSSCFQNLIQYSPVTCSHSWILLTLSRHLSWLFSSPVPKGWENTWCTFSSTLMSSLSMALWFSFCVLILWRQQKWKSSNKKPFQKELASAWVLQTSCKYFSKNNLTRSPLWFLFLLSLFYTAESQNNCSFWLVLLKILFFI